MSANYPFVVNPDTVDLSTDTPPDQTQDPASTAEQLAPDFSVGGTPLSGDAYAQPPGSIAPDAGAHIPVGNQPNYPEGFGGWGDQTGPQASATATAPNPNLPQGFAGWADESLGGGQVPQPNPAINPNPPPPPTNYGNDIFGSLLNAETKLPGGQGMQSFIHGFQDMLLPSAAGGAVALGVGALDIGAAVTAAIAGGETGAEVGAVSGLAAGGIGAVPGAAIGGIVGALVGFGAAIGGYALASWVQGQVAPSVVPSQTYKSYQDQTGYEQTYYGDQYALGGILPQALAFKANPAGLISAGKLVGKLWALPTAAKLGALVTDEGKAGVNQLLFMAYGGGTTFIQAKQEFDAYAKDPANYPPPQFTSLAINALGSILFSGEPRAWLRALPLPLRGPTKEGLQKVGQAVAQGASEAGTTHPTAQGDYSQNGDLLAAIIHGRSEGKDISALEQEFLQRNARIQAGVPEAPLEGEAGPVTSESLYQEVMAGKVNASDADAIAIQKGLVGWKSMAPIADVTATERPVSIPHAGETVWVKPEAIQADVYGHLVARVVSVNPDGTGVINTADGSKYTIDFNKDITTPASDVSLPEPGLGLTEDLILQLYKEGQITVDEANQYAVQNGLRNWTPLTETEGDLSLLEREARAQTGEQNGIQQEATGLGQETGGNDQASEVGIPGQASQTGQVGSEATGQLVPGQETNTPTGAHAFARIAGGGATGTRTGPSTIRSSDLGAGDLSSSRLARAVAAISRANAPDAARGISEHGSTYSPESFTTRYSQAAQRGTTIDQEQTISGLAGGTTGSTLTSSADAPEFQDQVLAAHLKFGNNPDQAPLVVGSERLLPHEHAVLSDFQAGTPVPKQDLFIPDDPKLKPKTPDNAVKWPVLAIADPLVDAIRAHPKGDPILEYIPREINTDAERVALITKGWDGRHFFDNVKALVDTLVFDTPQEKAAFVSSLVTMGDGTDVPQNVRAALIHYSRVKSGAYQNTMTGVRNDPVIRQALQGLGLIKAYTPTGVSEANLARSDSGLAPESRKLSDYGGALNGEARGPSDKWSLRTEFGIDKPPTDSPDDAHYNYAFGRRNWLARLFASHEPGIHPGQIQSAEWTGMHMVVNEQIARIKAAARATGDPQLIKQANSIRGNLLPQDMSEIFHNTYQLVPGSRLGTLEWDKILAGYGDELMRVAGRYASVRYVKGRLGSVTATGKRQDIRDIQMDWAGEILDNMSPSLTGRLSDFYGKYILNGPPTGPSVSPGRAALQLSHGDVAEKLMQIAYQKRHPDGFLDLAKKSASLMGMVDRLDKFTTVPVGQIDSLPTRNEVDSVVLPAIDEVHDILGLPRGLIGVRYSGRGRGSDYEHMQFDASAKNSFAYYHTDFPNEITINLDNFSFIELLRNDAAGALREYLNKPGVTKHLSPESVAFVDNYLAGLTSGNLKSAAQLLIAHEIGHAIQDRLGFLSRAGDEDLVDKIYEGEAQEYPAAERMFDFLFTEVNPRYVLGAVRAGWGSELESLIYHVSRYRGDPTSLNELVGGVQGARPARQIMSLETAMNTIAEHQTNEFSASKKIPHSGISLTANNEVYTRGIDDSKFAQTQASYLGKAYSQRVRALYDQLAAEADTQLGGRGPNPAIGAERPSSDETTAGIFSYSKLTPDAANSGDPTSGWSNPTAADQASVDPRIGFKDRIVNLNAATETLRARMAAPGYVPDPLHQQTLSILQEKARVMDAVAKGTPPISDPLVVDTHLQRVTGDAFKNVARIAGEAPDAYARRVVKASGAYDDLPSAVAMLKASRTGIFAVVDKGGEAHMQIGYKTYKGTPSLHTNSWDPGFHGVISESLDRIPTEAYASEPLDKMSHGLDSNVLRASFDHIAPTAKAGAVTKTDKFGKAIQFSRRVARPEDSSQPVVTRAKDFAESGEYDVKIGDKTYKIYRDPSSRMWHEAGTGEHYSRTYLGISREEAIADLVKRGQKLPPMGTGDFYFFKRTIPSWKLDPVSAGNQVEALHNEFVDAFEFQQKIKDGGIFDPIDLPKVAKKAEDTPVVPVPPEPPVVPTSGAQIAAPQEMTPEQRVQAKKDAADAQSKLLQHAYVGSLLPILHSQIPGVKEVGMDINDIISHGLKGFDVKNNYSQSAQTWAIDADARIGMMRSVAREGGQRISDLISSLSPGANERISSVLYADQATRQTALEGLSEGEAALADHLSNYFRLLGDTLERAGVIKNAEENYIPLILEKPGTKKGSMFGGGRAVPAQTAADFTVHSIERIKDSHGENLFNSPEELQNLVNNDPFYKGWKVKTDLGELFAAQGESVTRALGAKQTIDRLSELEIQIGKNEGEVGKVIAPPAYFRKNSIAQAHRDDYRPIKYGPWQGATEGLLVHKSIADVLERPARVNEMGSDPAHKFLNFMAGIGGFFKQYKFNSPVHAYSMLADVSTHTGVLGVHRVLARGNDIVHGEDRLRFRQLKLAGAPDDRNIAPEQMNGPAGVLQRLPGPAGWYFRKYHDIVWGKIGYNGLYGLSDHLSNELMSKWQAENPTAELTDDLRLGFDKQGVLDAKKALGYLNNMDMSKNYDMWSNVLFLASKWTTGQLRTMGDAFNIKALARLGSPIPIEGATPEQTDFLQRKGIEASRRLVIGGMVRLLMTSLVLSTSISSIFNNGVPVTPWDNFQKDPNHTFDIYAGRDQTSGRDNWLKNPFFLFQREMLDWAMAGVKAQMEGQPMVDFSDLTGNSVLTAPLTRFASKLNPGKVVLEAITGNELAQWMKGYSKYGIDQDPYILNINKSLQGMGVPDFGSLENRLIYAFRSLSPSINFAPDLSQAKPDAGAVANALGIGTFNPMKIENLKSLGLGVLGTRLDQGSKYAPDSNGHMVPVSQLANEYARQQKLAEQIVTIAQTMGNGTPDQEMQKLEQMDGLRQSAGYTPAQISQILLFGIPGPKDMKGLIGLNAAQPAPGQPRSKSDAPTVINGKALTPQQEVAYQSVVFQRQMYGLSELMNDPTWTAKDASQQAQDASTMKSFTDRITNEQFGQAIGSRRGSEITNNQALSMVAEFGIIKRTSQQDLLKSALYTTAKQADQQVMMSDRIAATENAVWAKYFGTLKGASDATLTGYVELQTGLRDSVRRIVEKLPSFSIATPFDQAAELKYGLTFADNLAAQSIAGKTAKAFNAPLNQTQLYAAVRNGIVLQDAALNELHHSSIYLEASTDAERTTLNGKYVALAHTIALADMRHGQTISAPYQGGFDTALKSQLAADQGYQSLVDTYFGPRGQIRLLQYTTELANLKSQFKQDHVIPPAELSKYDSMINRWYYQQNPDFYNFITARSEWEKYDPIGQAWLASSQSNLGFEAASPAEQFTGQ